MYEKISVCNSIPPAKLKKCVTGGSLNLTKHELHGTGSHIYVHRDVAEKIKKALKANKGVRFQHNPNEIVYGLNAGGSIFSKIGDFFKNKALPFLKQHWRPILSGVMDVGSNIVPALAGPRAQIKSLTGLGVAGKKSKLVKGSAEAKAHMARIRGMKKGGGSFRL